MAAVWLAGGAWCAQAAEMKFEAVLLWGTDDSKPPEGKTYKPVASDVLKRLKDLPLKWANWFEVKRITFAVTQGTTKDAPISDKCALKVKNLGGNEAEVSLIGKGKEVMKRKQALPKQEMLFLGGNAPNSTAWLVGLKRIE